ncbi:hypothetical protein AgCh_008334 [Apium graveolens]
MYVVEFQKRGLPHVHTLIWLDDESKRNLAANVDKFVSAEIPDPLTDPVGYEAVKYLMIHGPCGLENTKSPCMKEMKCSKHFPKKETYFDQSGFPIYLHRNTGIAVAKGKKFLTSENYGSSIGTICPSGGREVVVDELTWWDKAWLGEAKLGFQKPCIYEKLGGMNGEDLRRNGWWMECITWIDDTASRLCFFASGKEAQACTHSNLS